MFPALTQLFNNLAVSFDLPILDWIQANLQSDFMEKTKSIFRAGMSGNDAAHLAC